MAIERLNGGYQAPSTARQIPPYPHRAGCSLRDKPEDYGDGGAYPEIHSVQHPLGMGQPRSSKSSKTLALTTDASGAVNYGALAQQGQNRTKTVFSSHTDMVPKGPNSVTARPTAEDEKEVADDTWKALQRTVEKKIAAVQPKTLPAAPGAAQFIKYTPSQQGGGHNSGAAQRIIKVQDLAVDPLEPPKFRHTKVPRGPGSPPVPVMHSPPRKLSGAEARDWKIPPCISNWKNPKGFTIPLDKRLAADGRGLQEVQINDRFAQMSEALIVAENLSRQEIELQNKMLKERARRDQESREEELRQLAMRARNDRMAAGGAAARLDAETLPGPPPGAAREDALPGPPLRGAPPVGGDASPGPPSPRGERRGEGPSGRESREEREERRQRDEIREERRKERERERRLEAKDQHGIKRSKTTRDRERDISEKVALGMANVKAGGGETMYDSRLFNQEQGMGSGFGGDESYAVYDKQLFADRTHANLFKPTQAAAGEDGDPGDGGARRFRADKGFQGAETSGLAAGGTMQFERPAADPFGLDQFMDEHKGKK